MKTKKEFKFFTIADYEKEQAYLSSMHQYGWKFVKVVGLCMYHFEGCEPEKVTYQLDYNQDGLAHKDEYIQMFTDCGWEYIQDSLGWVYFRKNASKTDGDEAIFCDDESRLQMMERVFKGRLIPLLVVFSAILFPQFFGNVFGLRNHGVTILTGALIVFYGVIIVLYVSIFIKYRRYKNNLKK